MTVDLSHTMIWLLVGGKTRTCLKLSGCALERPELEATYHVSYRYCSIFVGSVGRFRAWDTSRVAYRVSVVV